MNDRLIRIGIPTLHCYSRLARLLLSLDNDRSFPFDLEFTIIDNGGQLKASKWMETIDNIKSKVTVIVPEENLGVSKSWNFLINKLGKCIISNDDVIFYKSDIAIIFNALGVHDDAMFIGEQVGGWSLFWVNKPDQWMAMGGFDEKFYPAYYEDDDANYRLKLAGVKRLQVTLPGWHHENSSTLYSGSEAYQRSHWQSFGRNGAYYVSKWGGMPNQETFLYPFNHQ
jgi:GT2 family glycosyltransferase